jgi:competence ComEA-like helix-hairpin-helix protein
MFNLTNDERRVLIFLIAIALLGLGVNFFIKQFTPQKRLSYYSDELGKVNLNTADKKTLMGVTGIGEKLSQRIIDYRIEEGGFQDLDELKEIKGITEKKFEKIKVFLIVK